MADYNINAVTRRIVYTGSAGVGPYAFSFEILAQTDVDVYFNTTLLTITTDYTVTINANGTGSVTIVTGSSVPSTPDLNDRITIVGARDIERMTDFVTAGELRASALNEQLDALTIFDQQLLELSDRAVRAPVTDPTSVNMELPAQTDRADKILKFDSNGNVAVESAEVLAGAAIVGANFTNNVFTGTGAQTAFTLTVAPGSKNNAQVYIDGVYQLKSSFSVSGTTLTFTEAPPLNAQIEVVIGNAIDTLDADSGNINYNQGGTGAQTRTVESKLQESVSVKDFGAVGDGVTDDTAAIQAALNAASGVYFGDASDNYLVNGTINLNTNQFISGDGAKITQSATDTEIFNVNNKTDITITGINFVGKTETFLDSDSARSVAVYIESASSSSKLKFYNNKFENFRYTSVRAKNANDVSFVDNIVVGPGTPVLTAITSGSNYGFLADADCSRVFISGNNISKTAQGLRINKSTDVKITNNEIFDIDGQHGIYAGPALSGFVATNNSIRNTDLIGIKVQQEATYADMTNIVISNNVIDTVGGDGISILHASGSTTQTEKIRDCVVSGNVIRTATAYGIISQNCINININDNSVNDAGGSGVIFSVCDQMTISNNHFINVDLSGIRDQTASSNFSIKGNRIHNAARDVTAGDKYGIFLQGGTNLQIAHNIISDANTNMEHGIYIAGGTQTSQSVYGNIVLNATSTAFRVGSSADDFFILRDNAFVGTGGAATNNPDIVDVASASTVTLRTYQDTFRITGTTGITSINAAGHTGHKVNLIFSDVLTVTDGSNLKLAGNFTTSADDTMTLICDGTNWFELSRSAN